MTSLTYSKTRGFTLLEMAIVLAILAVLLGGLLPLLSGQMEQQRRNETGKQLNEIRDALYGYAIINGYLPCPTTTTDPASANYGNADTACSANLSAEGYLPWKTLGVAEMDAWGIKRGSSGAAWTGYWRYRVDRNFADPGNKFTLGTGFSADALTIRDNVGNNITSSSERPVAIVYSTGPDIAADGQNASFESSSGIYQSDVPSPTFDDITIWIARPQLFNRMVSAGKLP